MCNNEISSDDDLKPRCCNHDVIEVAAKIAPHSRVSKGLWPQIALFVQPNLFMVISLMAYA